jgi:SAM-dependent methyltransferase
MSTATPSASPAAPDTDYRAIYDHVLSTNPGYAQASTSPGVNACWLEADRIRTAVGPALDVGCGMGFVVELLRGHHFGLDAWGVDVSGVGVREGNRRMAAERLALMTPGRIPHPDARFGLVTCFDVLEHTDEDDARALRDEMRRVLRPGGLLYCSIATRPASGRDQHGDNLHRTVRPAHWWADLFDADELRWRRRQEDLYLFWRKP